MTWERHDEETEARPEQRRPPGVRRYAAWAAIGVALITVGATGGVVWSERRVATRESPRASLAGPRSEAPPASSEPASEEPVEVTLTPQAAERAGITLADVRSDAASAAVSVPATVTSNAYRDTKVNALVGGIVRQVTAELGSSVRRGQPLAVIFSAELADAQMKYLSMRAMLEADHQKRVRTEKLVALGAASRQELEEVTAIHTAHDTELAAARQRLLLLGLSADRVAKLENASQVVSEVTVTSPGDGVVVTRTVNPGQVVGAGQDLFVVTDLSTVWVIGELYEKDFANVHVGAQATISVLARPDAPVRGRVTYIDPRVDLAARTAKVRVEVPNPDAGLRLGMFVTATFHAAHRRAVTLVPQRAVQAIGERTVVYVPAKDEEAKFIERLVTLGAPIGEFRQVLHGLKPGERVVTDGSFFLRAEAARMRVGS